MSQPTTRNARTPGEPLSRGASHLSAALTHVRSIDAHPPHHAHFDERPEGIHPEMGKAGELEHRPPKSVVDIEHVPVDDDPREWSNTKKNLVLTMMTISVVNYCLLEWRRLVEADR